MDFNPFESNEKYDFYSFNNAFEILKYAHPVEFKELLDAFDKFYILKSDLLVGGGSESKIPKRFASYLRPSWRESRISADLYVKHIMRSPTEERQFVIPDYMDGYLIDYVKGKVAFDMEWNSKDQTFDRDLYAFRAFYETGIIDVGGIITRDVSLNPVFQSLGIMKKYGASTTWLGKLLPRIRTRRHGGCPLFIVAIKSGCIADLENETLHDE